MEDVKVLEVDGNWVTAIINGHWCQAKIYAMPSQFGYRKGRVSKLCISRTESRLPIAYQYDRGLDFSRLPITTVNSIVRQLEKIEL